MGTYGLEKNIIKSDPRPQNQNGKLFQTFLDQSNHLTVVNSLDVCSGSITRVRKLKCGKLEESILDFFIVCDRLLPYLIKMTIDVDRRFIWSNYTSARKYGHAKDSNHFSLIMVKADSKGSL